VLLPRSYRRKLFAVKLKKDFAVPVEEAAVDKGSEARTEEWGQVIDEVRLRLERLNK
jgi:hypothetical protein